MTGEFGALLFAAGLLAGFGSGAACVFLYFRSWCDEHDRKTGAERRELLTRIQGWEPEPPRKPAPAGGHPASESHAAESAEWDQARLADSASKGILPNEDGGYWDTHSRWLFDSIEDIEAWRAMLLSKKLPITLNPGLANDMGFEDAMSMARNFASKEKDRRIAEESGDAAA